MPEFPPIQLYAILAVAITIESLFFALIREPTPGPYTGQNSRSGK